MDWSYGGRGAEMLWNVTVKSKTHTSFRRPAWKLSYIMKKICFLSISCLSMEGVEFGCDSNSCLVFLVLLQWKEGGQKNLELLFIISQTQKTEIHLLLSYNLVNNLTKAIFSFLIILVYRFFSFIFKMQRNILHFWSRDNNYYFYTGVLVCQSFVIVQGTAQD